MFEALNSASQQNKYQLTWVEMSPVELQGVIPGWFDQLKKSRMMSGVSSAQRKALANEFYRLLHIQKTILTTGAPAGAQAMAAQRCDVNIRWFQQQYQTKFGPAPLTAPSPESGLDQLLKRSAALTAKLGTLDLKLSLINYWIRGVDNFPEHRADASLMFQYMGNAPTEKVRLFLEVICSDAEKMVSLKDPGAFKTSFETQAGLQTAGEDGKLYAVAWTNDLFKKAVKAEIGASYGVSAKGACELEFKGLKATLEAEAWAGARAKAEGEASWGVGSGGTLKGTVEAEIGVKISGTATLDCADIFLCEASAEAFAGAVANATVEITATVSGVALKIEAEAFAGARIKGEAGMTLRLQGYEIVSAKATGALTAGIGAKFGLEFESSAFGGTKFKIEAGTTVGLGAEAGTEFKVQGDNIERALYSLYFTTYLQLLGKNEWKETWKKHFRELEDNKALFLRGRSLVEEHMKIVILERNQLFSERTAWKQLQGLAAFRRGSP
jgi:hypothetical protein